MNIRCKFDQRGQGTHKGPAEEEAGEEDGEAPLPQRPETTSPSHERNGGVDLTRPYPDDIRRCGRAHVEGSLEGALQVPELLFDKAEPLPWQEFSF